MKKYRLGYDFVFLPKGSLFYQGETIGGMTTYVIFKLFREDGEEMLFESEDFKEQLLHVNGNSIYIQHLLLCYFDEEKAIRFEVNTSLMEKYNIPLRVEWQIDGYSKDLGIGVLDAFFVEKEEFFDIMKTNSQSFDNPDNHPAQTTTYFTKEVS